ncbi:ankyrin repeat domain-containing protein [Desulfosarcina alkanivorans]|nr:ankyrin repeat domain-containing protein [Desulfosarcina alkanivorans]
MQSPPSTFIMAGDPVRSRKRRGCQRDAGQCPHPADGRRPAQKRPRGAQVLLESGIAPDDRRYRAATPLIVATRNGDTRTAAILLEHGALPDGEPPGGMAALSHAAANGDASMTRLLLANGADPNRRAFGRFSPMYRAVESGCVECVRLLAGAGGLPIGKTNKNESVAALVIRRNQLEIKDIFRDHIRSGAWRPMRWAPRRT